MTSFRVTVDCKTIVCIKSTAKTPNQHSEFCSTIPNLINVFHVYLRGKTDTTQASLLNFLTSFDSIRYDSYHTIVAQLHIVHSHFTVYFKSKFKIHTEKLPFSQLFHENGL